MQNMNIKTSIQAAGLKKAYNYIDKDPANNILKVMNFLDTVVPPDTLAGQRRTIRAAVSDPENNWYRFLLGLWSDLDGEVRKTLFDNLVINAVVNWEPVRENYMKKYGCNIPWTLLIDPTSACNLHCTGCWAAEYGNKMNMDFDTLDSIVLQGKEMGIRFFLFSGGEPLVRKKDIIALCEKHGDSVFTAFTNGTLIDEAFADEMLRVRNFIPAISVEGFEDDTDFRRGKGTFSQVRRAMEILKRKKLPFGVSCCYTSKNVEQIGSEEYFDWMIEQGAKFCWFFTYMPVGSAAVPELMATAEQRRFMYERIRRYRGTKPLFTMDFWNDGEYVGGCIAGGRNYLHVNANGDIEPCAFIHYSDSNIREKTLLEALQSPLFMAYKEGQPFNKNHLRPCPLLDNPGALARMVDTSGAHSTDMQSPEDVYRLSEKCREKAEKWAPVADDLWRCSGKCVPVRKKHPRRVPVRK
jgi:MoaA/NifB/PqqE/SkfB family radical SAM enzyme